MGGCSRLRVARLLCRAAAFDAGNWDMRARGGARLADGRRESPAARLARQAAILLIYRFRWRIFRAEHLIHRLAPGQIALWEPALAVVRAATVVPPPVDVGDGILEDRVVGFRKILAVVGRCAPAVLAAPGGIIWPAQAWRKASCRVARLVQSGRCLLTRND
jgi:hypothetical protein